MYDNTWTSNGSGQGDRISSIIINGIDTKHVDGCDIMT